jgi:segregation and condensation protein B
MDINKLKNILEAVLLAAERTLTVVQLEALFELDEERPSRDEIRKALHEMADDYVTRGYELKQVASGFRLQVKQEFSTWVGRLWEERPARYTRALLETMALIAYRQPITRGEIEEVRGVSVSSNIIKTLLERDWIKVLGHKDVPGKPSLYGTTKEFLDYFNLKTLDQLPTLAEIQDLDSIHPELELDENALKHSNEENSDKPESDQTESDDNNNADGSSDSNESSLNNTDTADTRLDEAESEEVSEDADTVRPAFNV